MRTQFVTTVAAGLMLVLSITVAGAQDADLLAASDPASIVELAKGHGSAALSKGEDGDPLIKGRIQGIAYTIYFFGCTDHKECSSLQLHSGFEPQKKPTVAKLNDWNRTKRFAKAYADKDGYPHIEMDIPMSDGIPRASLDRAFVSWSSLMKDFAVHVRYEAG